MPHANHERPAVPFRPSREAREAEVMLDHIVDDFLENPEAMAYFYDLFRRVYIQGEALESHGPQVGTTCIQAPEELIYAHGASPVRLCNGSYHYDQVGADLMPLKSCSLVKATLGMLLSKNAIPRIGQLDLIVNPTTCDQKKKASVMMEGMGYAVHDLELPNAKESEAARVYWQRSVKQFSERLRALTGVKLTKTRLREAMAKTARAQEAFRTMSNFCKCSPSVFLGKDAFLVTNAYFFDDLDRWTLAVEKLNAELAERVKNGFNAAQKKAPRIVFTGSPPIFPNLKLPLLIEQSGGVVVADETCSANRMLYDMTAVDEWLLDDMVDSLADKYLKPCTCPIFTRNDDRLRRLLELAQSFKADGVVYQSFSGCQVYEMEQKSVADALNKAGIPMLYIETDYSPDDMGQLMTRIEAFLESIKSRKRQQRKLNYFAGIDIGSTAIKVALVDAEGKVKGVHVADSGSLFHKNAKEALRVLLDREGVAREAVKYLIATGYGRKLFKEADDSISEITANAIGAHEAGKAFGGVRTIINIGGQDSKAIQIDSNGNVTHFAMNDKCAAGTGRFLDVVARNLDLDLEDLGDIHFAGDEAPLTINSTCTVFAESEIIGLLAHGHSKAGIVAGIHYSIAKRTVRLAKRVGIEDRVYMDGGPALNKGLVAAIEDELQRPLVVPEYPQTTTAIGAAVLARSEYLAD